MQIKELFCYAQDWTVPAMIYMLIYMYTKNVYMQKRLADQNKNSFHFRSSPQVKKNEKCFFFT